MQWTKSIVTLNQPEELLRNKFLPKIDPCVGKAYTWTLN